VDTGATPLARMQNLVQETLQETPRAMPSVPSHFQFPDSPSDTTPQRGEQKHESIISMFPASTSLLETTADSMFISSAQPASIIDPNMTAENGREPLARDRAVPPVSDPFSQPTSVNSVATSRIPIPSSRSSTDHATYTDSQLSSTQPEEEKSEAPGPSSSKLSATTCQETAPSTRDERASTTATRGRKRQMSQSSIKPRLTRAASKKQGDVVEKKTTSSSMLLIKFLLFLPLTSYFSSRNIIKSSKYDIVSSQTYKESLSKRRFSYGYVLNH
jgi:hypothetical protein